MINPKHFFFLLFYFFLFLSFSQSNPPESILIKGKIIDGATFLNLSYSLVVNKNTSIGIIGDLNGEFSVSAQKSDTIIISVRGYSTKKICFSDSVSKAVYEVEIIMNKLMINLREVEIKQVRKIEEIESDISKIKEYNRLDYMLSGLNAVQSPITFFYQKYSRRESSKRKVTELKMEEVKRGIIKELLSMYVKANIIQLEEKDFDDFIDYCKVDIEYLKNCTQYEFIVFIKKRYAEYLNLPPKINK